MLINRFPLIFSVIGSFLLCVESVNSNNIITESCSLCGFINQISNVTSNIVEKIDSVSFPENIPLQQEYDFIIIGSGPSGCYKMCFFYKSLVLKILLNVHINNN